VTEQGAVGLPAWQARLSVLQLLQVLLTGALVMNESYDEASILRLANTEVSAVGGYRLDGVYLDGSWRVTAGNDEDAGARSDIESQLAGLTGAEGQLAVAGDGWTGAFELHSRGGRVGYLVIGGDCEPSPAVRFLLRFLAQQTGVAIANVRTHSREQAAARDLRSANTALARSVAELERSTAIYDRLIRPAATGPGRGGIARALHELTGYPIAIEDESGSLRAWAGPGRPDPYPRQSRAARDAFLARARREHHPIRIADRLVALTADGDDDVSVLMLIDPDGTAGDQERVALEHGARVLAMQLARLHTFAETDVLVRRDLVEGLLAGSDFGAVTRAEALGYDLTRPHQVLVVECRATGRDDQAVFHAVRRAGRDTGVGMLQVARGRVVVVLGVAGAAWAGFRTAVVAELGTGTCRVGVGGRCTEPKDFPRSHREALLALRVQHATGSPAQVTVFDDLGVYRLLAALEDPAIVEQFVERWLSGLLEYDRMRGSGLVMTLTRYLDCGRSYEATAHALVVHRSTLKYRLQRVREISGHDLGDADTAFNLQLACRAWQTLVALQGGG
jgi:hypothetical protein